MSGTALDFVEAVILAALDVEGVGFVAAVLALAIVEHDEHDGEENRTKSSEANRKNSVRVADRDPGQWSMSGADYVAHDAATVSCLFLPSAQTLVPVFIPFT